MTRKDYIRIAEVIEPNLTSLDIGRVNVAEDIARDLAEMFKADNPRFDKERFLGACGFEAPEEV